MKTKEPILRGKIPLPALCILVWFISLLAGCANGSPTPAALTPLAEEMLPTVIALTIQAAHVEDSLIQNVPSEGATSLGERTSTAPAASRTAHPSPASPSPQPVETLLSSTAQLPEATSTAAGALNAVTPSNPATTPITTMAQGEAATLSTVTTISEAATISAASPSPTLYMAQIEEAITIYAPGPASKVVSPLQLKADVRADIGWQVWMEIVGEDGRILTREIKEIRGIYKAGYASLQMDLEFEISSPAEEGRLKISLYDALGRTVALNSVPVVLLSYGYADILTPLNLSNPIQIQQPSPHALAQGGKLVVSGVARIENGQPLMARLVGAGGNELGARLAGLSPAGQGDLRSFTTEIPYKVSEPTEALLVVWAGGDSYQDILYLASIEVMLVP